MEGRPPPPTTAGGGASTPNGVANGTPAPQAGENQPAEAPSLPAGITAEFDELRQLVESRAVELDALRSERLALRVELDALRVRLADLPDEVVASSGPFQLLQSHVQHLQLEFDTKKGELAAVQKDADELRVGAESFRDMTQSEAAAQIEEVQKRLLGKEADLARIRAQREEYAAEARELKAKEADKMKHVQELMTLAASRQERITAYDSQVRRLKMSAAAREGRGETVDLLAKGEEDEVVHDLQSRLK